MPTAASRSPMPLDSPRDLVIGTRNRKKGVELAELLAPYGYAVVTLADVPRAIEVIEDGDSFAANAALKASQQARHLGRWVLADDSGLEVDALGGAPGVYSARFAEATVKQNDEARMTNDERRSPLMPTDEANNRHLLAQLADTSLERRTARYVCHVTLADPTGAIQAESEEYCCGRIRFDASGANGFGYDPLFEVVEYHRTFGELGPRVKRAISHRARALRAILPQLLRARAVESGSSPPIV